MKQLLLLTFLLFSLLSTAQLTTINPDTVCYQTSGSIYEVPSLGAGYTYTWTVSAPGVITSGQGTNNIGVDWSSAAPGLIPNAVSVYATNVASGCQSNVVTLNVLILNVIPIIDPIGPLCTGDPCTNLIGSPIGGTWSGVGVQGSQFCPTISGSGTFVITYTVTEGGCTFTSTINVTVNPIPVLTPISHN